MIIRTSYKHQMYLSCFMFVLMLLCTKYHPVNLEILSPNSNNDIKVTERFP